jgi:uncharacterized protein (TIGR03435 family)
LRWIILEAYQLQNSQLLGGPEWIAAERFDISAKAEGDPPSAQMRLMLQRLLADRFGLKAHTEKRDLPVYLLQIARGDARLGPQLRRSETDCDHPPALPADGDPRTPCGFFGPGVNHDGPSFRGVTIERLAGYLTNSLGRTVVDRTGLKGYFDGDFDFSAEFAPPPPPPGAADRWDRQSLVSIFTVLSEQLGLRLDSTRGPVDVLVIDSVEHPTPD